MYLDHRLRIASDHRAAMTNLIAHAFDASAAASLDSWCREFPRMQGTGRQMLQPKICN